MPSSKFAYSGWESFPLNLVPVIKGEDVIEARKRLKVSQRVFAQHMGVEVRTVQRWEANPDHWIKNPCQAREVNAILKWVA